MRSRRAGAAVCAATLAAILCAGCASADGAGTATRGTRSGSASAGSSRASSPVPAAPPTGGGTPAAVTGTDVETPGPTAGSGQDPARPSTAAHGSAELVDKTVGALFRHSLAAGHNCTGGVVDSPGGDLVVTAAHCINGSGKGMLFAPGYLDGRAPYGTWTVQAVYAAVPWIKRQDDQSDVAFLQVAPTSGAGPSVQAAVGGSRISDSTQPGQQVQVRGYVFDSDTPVTCTATVYVHDGYPAFDCPGFAGGTSGSPWIVEPTALDAAPLVIGVIGGLREGGCTFGTSYSAWFTAGTLALYRQAVAGASPSVLPAPKSTCP